ncbi:hypothetical protein [Rhodanobacter sp. BL-MT-08]
MENTLEERITLLEVMHREVFLALIDTIEDLAEIAETDVRAQFKTYLQQTAAAPTPVPGLAKALADLATQVSAAALR